MPQLSRLAIVFAVLIGGLVLARYFLVPETFGELGHYRSAAIDSVLAQPIQFGNNQAQSDDFRPSAQNSKNFHISRSPSIKGS